MPDSNEDTGYWNGSTWVPSKTGRKYDPDAAVAANKPVSAADMAKRAADAKKKQQEAAASGYESPLAKAARLAQEKKKRDLQAEAVEKQ